MPAMITMPSRQRLVDEAPSVKAAALAVAPSSLPVAEHDVRRAASSRRMFWHTAGIVCSGVNSKEREGKARPATGGPSSGQGKTRPFWQTGCKEGRASLNWLSEEDTCHAVSRSVGNEPGVGGFGVVGRFLCPQKH